MKYKLQPTKRIALLVARNNFVYRGVGAYVKSIIDWALSENFHIDIISDDKPRSNGMFDSFQGKVQWICPDNTIDDKVYKELSAFSKPFDITLSLNFRNALVKALSKHTYNLIITNVGESLDAVTSIGIHKYCRVLHPTHHESEAGVKVRYDIFSPGVADRYKALCGLPDVSLACQSTWVQANAQSAYRHKAHECLLVPPLIPEPSLLDFDKLPSTQWGVGFIGPWEPRKNPEAYIMALKKAQLPGVVLVPSEASAKKFKTKFAEANIDNKIYVGKTGEEKTEIIQSLAAAYHPAISETFGLGVLETAHTCPTILLSKNEWSCAHEDYCTIVEEQYVVKTLTDLYGKGVSKATQNVLKARNQFSRNQLKELVNSDTTDKIPKNNFYAKLATDGLINHSEFIEAQASFCTDEIYKMLKINEVTTVEVLHNYDNTYYRLRGSTLLPEESLMETLFEIF